MAKTTSSFNSDHTIRQQHTWFAARKSICSI